MIFYSRQKELGTVTYSLIDGDSEIIRNDFPYADGSEIGRVLRFSIETDGQISVSE